MELTAEQLATIVRHADLRLGGFRQENRTNPRHWIGRKALLVRTAATRRTNLTGMVRDVSQTGIGLVVQQRLKAKEEFVLAISAVNEDQAPLVVRCAVVRCEQAAGGASFLVGARFAGEMDRGAGVEFRPAPRGAEPPPATAEEALARRIRAAILG
ncbi:MAG: PilZ domain-containing protein [Phycisphaerae bacterium]|nr:PilZ domain-containing protein [Tepidisphaeraceae bacterium]